MLITMCGRFTVTDELYEIRIAVSAQLEQLFRPWQPIFNVAPSAGPGHEQLIVVSSENGQRTLKLARWWFVPPRWNKPLNGLPTTFNARADRIHTKSMWRSAFQSNRCLVPANGWREFKHHEGQKTPYYFHFNHSLFAFAGLHSQWQQPNGESVDTFAIITTDANSSGKPIHDRMPLVVPSTFYDDWLSNATEPTMLLNDLCSLSHDSKVQSYPCDPIANDVRYEGPQATAKALADRINQGTSQYNLFGDNPAFAATPNRGKRHRS